MIPLVSVVFPLPRSPFNSTRTGGRSFEAIFRPLAMVSSEEFVMNSFVAISPDPSEIGCACGRTGFKPVLLLPSPLRKDARVRFRDRVDQVGSDQGRFSYARRGDIAREAM